MDVERVERGELGEQPIGDEVAERSGEEDVGRREAVEGCGRLRRLSISRDSAESGMRRRLHSTI